jgi:uncharacterized protein
METQTTQKNDTDASTLLTNKRIQGALSVVLILLAVFLFAESIKSLKEYRFVGGGIAPTNAITVSGEGELFQVPDTAEFTFTILEEAKTSAEVQKIATDKANEAIKALVDSGIEEKDIKTIGYNLYPKYEYKVNTVCITFPCERNQEQVGFELSQSVSVKVQDLDKAGEMLELVTSKGVSSVSGLTFTIADEDGIQAEVRKLAIDDARAKAEKLADDLGVTLVRIIGFSEGGYEPMMYERAVAMDATGFGGAEAKSAVSVPAGENRLVSNVSITYEIR